MATFYSTRAFDHANGTLSKVFWHDGRKSHDYDSKKEKNEKEKFKYNACNDKVEV